MSDTSTAVGGVTMSELLGSRGPFAALLPGFAPRPQQQALSEAIHAAMASGGTLIGEAGTGVGKTFAYLVPALFTGARTIVSTGTRHLQDQIFHNDIPLVRRALGAHTRAALLKGRANYLCRHRLRLAKGSPALGTPELLDQLRQVEEWSGRTRTGDIAEMTALPETAPIWAHVTSDADFCGEHEPGELEGCFVHQARRAAMAADLVVVNHHLFFADLGLKEIGYGELLPSVDAIVLDEAHQLPEAASQFFGRRLTSRQLRDLARDCAAEQASEARDMPELRDAATVLELESTKFRLTFAGDPQRQAWQAVADHPKVREALDRLHAAYLRLHALLDVAAPRSKGLQACLRRCETQQEVLDTFVEASAKGEWVHWYESYRNGYALSQTPLDISAHFQRIVTALPAAWIYTSATLSVGGRFEHFRRQLGLAEAEECRQDSPFDYRRNALLYLPESLPEPRAVHYTYAVMQRIAPVLEASRGRAFCLFTSHRALREAAEWLKPRCPFPVLVQGDRPKLELLAEFQARGNAVLLGTASFWEGVDVRGQALSCVIIDKLPFASPGDPVMQARIEALRERGGNPFFDYQVPQAAIVLKQGVGRLIRGTEDRGVLVLCDPRLVDKGYGRVFLRSLPPIPRTRSLEDVQRFFAEEVDEGDAGAGESGA